MEKIDYSTSPEKLSDELKRSASKYMISAWEAFDDSRESLDKKQYTQAYDSIFNAIENGIKSLCILYSASLHIEAEPGLLKHLISSRHKCFIPCNKNFIEHYNWWKEYKGKIGSRKSITRYFIRFIKETETVLNAIETYNFYVKHQVYYSRKEDIEINRRRNISLLAIGILLLMLSVLYPVYKYLDPVLNYETKGQFFWRSNEVVAENERDSIKFVAYGDGKFHNYSLDVISSIDFINGIESIKAISLRFDPVSESGTQIWIDNIELFEKNKPDPVIFSFNKSSQGWKGKKHIDNLVTRDGCLIFNSVGRDPSIKISNLSINLVRIKIRMKLIRKQSFMKWIFL